MSRIDRAWRRASGQAVEECVPQPLVASPSKSSASPDELTLGRYVVEQTTLPERSVPRERPDPVAPVSAPQAKARVSDALRGKLVITPETMPLPIEQYSRLAAVLHQLQTVRPLRSMMISSTLPREGKTLTATNIALTLSESYRRRVLLLDADFHRPSIHEVFGIPNAFGLADALRSPGAHVPSVEISETLSVLPAGQIGDSRIAVLSSDVLRTLVADAAERFDWVLLDTPPVAMLTDAHLVARAVDAVLFVIMAGATPYTLVQRSLAEIGTDRIVGTVLNCVDERDLAVHDYYRRHNASEK